MIEPHKVIPPVQLTEATRKAYIQKNTPEVCPLCGREMKYVLDKVLDHDHKTGHVRDVVCRNCNGLEGKIHGLCVRAGKQISNSKFLENVVAYWKKHSVPSGVLYPKKAKPKRRRTV